MILTDSENANENDSETNENEDNVNENYKEIVYMIIQNEMKTIKTTKITMTIMITWHKHHNAQKSFYHSPHMIYLFISYSILSNFIDKKTMFDPSLIKFNIFYIIHIYVTISMKIQWHILIFFIA